LVHIYLHRYSTRVCVVEVRILESEFLIAFPVCSAYALVSLNITSSLSLYLHSLQIAVADSPNSAIYALSMTKSKKANKANTSAKKSPYKRSSSHSEMKARCKAEKAIAAANETVERIKRCKEFSAAHIRALAKVKKVTQRQERNIRNAKKADKRINEARHPVKKPLVNRSKSLHSHSLPEILLQSGENLARVHPTFSLAEERLRARVHPSKSLANVGKLRRGCMESAKDYVGRLQAQEETLERENERHMDADLDLARRWVIVLIWVYVI